jgi:outer membrane immunogenic protein
VGTPMKKAAIGIVAVAAMIGTPVLAADMAVKAPPPPVPVDSWTGFYIGANIGGGWSRQSVNYTPNDPMAIDLFEAGGAPPPASFTSSGLIGGIQIGYNRQVNSAWLVGIETDFDGSGIRGSGSTSGTYAPYFMAPFIAPVQEQIDWFGTVRARLGLLPTNNLLVYGTAGFAYGRVAQSGSWNTNTPFAFGDGFHTVNCFPVPVCFAGSSSHIEPGWTAGGGLEYALWQKWTLRAEYLYVSLRQATVTETVLGPTPGALPSSFNAIFSRTNFNIARVGLNYEFH